MMRGVIGVGKSIHHNTPQLIGQMVRIRIRVTMLRL